jgi:hypothetical protein
MRIILQLMIVFFFLPSLMLAQRVNTSVHGMVGLPQGEYQKSIDQIGYGPEVSFRVSLAESPVWLGLDFGQMSLKHKTRFVNKGEEELELLPLKGEILAHLAARVQIEREGILPYFEVLIGIQHFYSQSVNDKDPIYFEQADASGFSTSEADKVLSGGMGAGLLFHVYQFKNEKSRFKELYIDTRLRFITGGEIEIIKELENSNGPGYESFTVRPNNFTFQVGLSFDF